MKGLKDLSKIIIPFLSDGAEELVSLYLAQNNSVVAIEGSDFMWQGLE